MADLPQDPTGKVVRHLFDLRRVENQLFFETHSALNFAEIEVVKSLIESDLGSAVRFSTKQRTLNRLMQKANEVIKETIGNIERKIRTDLRDLAIMESEFAGSVLDISIGSDAGVRVLSGRGVLSGQLLKNIIDQEPFDGLELKGWWRNQNLATRKAFRKQLQLGLTAGDSTAELVQRIRGTRAARFRDGILNPDGFTGRNVKAIVRTAVNQVSNRAAEETYRANADITKKYQYIATLDDRTTPICQTLDGQVFEYGKGPTPPQHFACRSFTVPIIDYKGLGLTPPPEGTRAAKGDVPGPVRASATYQDWLRVQSSKTQDRILGPARAKLFRERKVTLGDMLRNDGRRLTLPDLNAKLKSKAIRIKAPVKVLAPKPKIIPPVPQVSDIPDVLDQKGFKSIMAKFGVQPHQYKTFGKVGNEFLPDIARPVVRLFNTHPELAKVMIFRGGGTGTAYASAGIRAVTNLQNIAGGVLSVPRRMSFSSNWFGKKGGTIYKAVEGKTVKTFTPARELAERAMAKDDKTKWTFGSKIENTVTHEIGHIIDTLGYFDTTGPNEWGRGLRNPFTLKHERTNIPANVAKVPLKARLFLRSIRPKNDPFWGASESTRKRKLKFEKEPRPGEISRYGQTNETEGFAEYYASVVDTKFQFDAVGNITNLSKNQLGFLDALIEGYKDAGLSVPTYLLE